MSGGRPSRDREHGGGGSPESTRRRLVDRVRPRWRRLSGILRAHLGIDARALAAFRIALGGIVLLSLLLRSRYLSAFYTDAGVYPRSAMAELYPIAEQLSIHGQFGSAEMQALLFVVAGIAALALLVGYRTTLATVVSLGLLFSLHGRNPLVLNGGDILLRHLLLWAVFLPLGERWAVDAVRRERAPRSRIASMATAGLLLQVVIVYAVNAVLKHEGSLWREGTAIHYVFGLDQFTVLFGDTLAGFPGLLSAFGHLWLWMLTLSVLLVVLRGWPRAVFASLFVGAHATMGLTMQLGMFPLVSIAGLLAFYPARVWDVVEGRVARPLAVRLDDRRPASVPRPDLGVDVPSALQRGVELFRTYVVPAAAALVLVAMLVYTVGSVTDGGMGPLEVTDLTDGDPRWNMFAPNPLRSGEWYVMAGTLESGEQVDAFHGGPASWDRPPDLADTNPTARWRKYLSHVDDHSQADVLQRSMAEYLCRQWSQNDEGTIESITISYMSERIDLDGPDPIDRRDLLEYDCAG